MAGMACKIWYSKGIKTQTAHLVIFGLKDGGFEMLLRSMKRMVHGALPGNA